MTEHYCTICKKTETCKGEDCHFIELFSAHDMCYAESRAK